MVAVKESAIEYGFRHLDTISQLHHSKSPDEQLEAVSIVLESFGLDDESKSHLIQSVNDFVPEGRKTATGCVNQDLWVQLDAAVDQHTHVQWRHVNGHNGVKYNELVDELAVKAKKGATWI
jgi:hypothetical protein